MRIGHLILISALLVVTPSAVFAEEATLRRPVAMVLSQNGEQLFTANRDSGTVSIIETASVSVRNEIPVGGRLTDIVCVSDNQLLVLDEHNHQLIHLTRDKTGWHVPSRQHVAQYPVRIVVAGDSRHGYISSLWSRTISKFEWVAENSFQSRITDTIQVPFEPRELILANDDETLIVASAFDAQLAVIRTRDLTLSSLKDIPGHNVGGIAIDNTSEQLLIAQQELNPLAHSSRDDVHWGNMMSNVLVSIPLGELCDRANEVVTRQVTQLGEPGAAAADPGRMRIDTDGKIAILFSGVDEVAVADAAKPAAMARVSVGKRPVSAATLPDGRLLVANMFSDSISIIDRQKAEPVGQISLGAQPEMSLAERGEILFFDGRLSHDGWMSCHSCHTDGHSNQQLNDNLSDGSFGAAKRVLSLLGVADTQPWAWNGEVMTLEEQVASSIEKTMRGSTPDEQQIAAIVCYIKTLSPPTLMRTNTDIRQQNIKRGRSLFGSLGCANCHTPPAYTTAKSYNIGLFDEVGNDRFNPPSLRGVANRRLFFHDGRAKSLKEVFTKHKHQLTDDLAEKDLNSLIDFLVTLNMQSS